MDNTYPNSGRLFKNKNKKSETSPDYYGRLDVDGKLYDLSAWLKTNPKGTYMSLAVRPHQDQTQEH